MTTLTWYGHATLGLETAGKKLLIDPYFTDNPSATTTADEVTADYILVTHYDGDHVGQVDLFPKSTLLIGNDDAAQSIQHIGKRLDCQFRLGGQQFCQRIGLHQGMGHQRLHGGSSHRLVFVCLHAVH